MIRGEWVVAVGRAINTRNISLQSVFYSRGTYELPVHAEVARVSIAGRGQGEPASANVHKSKRTDIEGTLGAEDIRYMDMIFHKLTVFPMTPR